MLRFFPLLVVFLLVGFLVSVIFLFKEMNNFFVAFGLICTSAVYSQPSDGDSLRFVSVFLRHGARTPEFKDTYPNDPFKLDAFRPMGYGQLTDHGKNMAFTLGKVLRKRYDKFLGDIYTPEIVLAQTTDYDRTKMSALLVLAGLFPPSKSQQWNENLEWLPIPFEYDKDNRDYTLKRPNSYCPTYMKELEEVLQSEETLRFIKAHQSTFEYIANHTGKPVSQLGGVFSIYQTLTAEKTMNLTLPDWTKDVYPEKITTIAAKQCEMENSNDILKRLNGGRSLGRVIDNMVAKTEESLHPHERKIYIYSGHENNVINVLAAMDLYKTHFPNYSAAVLIELHYLRSTQEYAVKVLYVRDIHEIPEELTVPNCDVFCPLSKFISLTKNHVPKNYTFECDSLFSLD